MFISIIIPTYNRAQLIRRTIDSVIRQTDDRWELIIVDDGSEDETASVVQRYLSDKIRYVSQQNAGANKARNYGASLARYDYISFLDSDDELFPTWLEAFQAHFGSNPHIVCCGTQRIEPGGVTEVMPKSLGKIFNNMVGKFTNGACYVIDKKLFSEVGGFDEDLKSGQHTELSFRLADKLISKERTLVNIFLPLVKIHIHDGPRIRTNSDSKFRGALRIFEKHSALLSREPSLKRNYAKIISLGAARRKSFGVAARAFVIYCKYSILTRFS